MLVVKRSIVPDVQEACRRRESIRAGRLRRGGWLVPARERLAERASNRHRERGTHFNRPESLVMKSILDAVRITNRS